MGTGVTTAPDFLSAADSFPGSQCLTLSWYPDAKACRSGNLGHPSGIYSGSFADLVGENTGTNTMFPQK